MRKRLMVVVGAAVLTMGGTGAPALAGTNTPATFELGGGGLSISAPSASVDLGTYPTSAGTVAVSGAMGDVTVTDNRGGVLGWTASAISTAFTPGSGAAVPASDVSYTPGTVTTTGVSVVASAAPTNLTTASTVATATAVVGNNSATWNPTIHVAVPGGAVAGTYSATITHSVA